MYFQGTYNLDGVDEDADYVIFDDLNNPDSWYSYKQWMGGQRDFNTTDKYKKKRQVAGGWPCIVLMNDDPSQVKGWDQNWIAGNCVSVYINRPLWEDIPDYSDLVYLEDVM